MVEVYLNFLWADCPQAVGTHLCAIKNLFPQKILVSAAISYGGIEGPYFIGSTMSAESYGDLFEGAFLPAARSQSIVDGFWLMQDGAWPYRTRQVFDILNSACENRTMVLYFDKHYVSETTMPASSPDLNPCDFYLRGYLKIIVLKSNPKTMNELKLAISKTFSEIPPEHCSFRNRLTGAKTLASHTRASRNETPLYIHE